jgi:ribonuclease P/MRP protein subunit RPP40
MSVYVTEYASTVAITAQRRIDVDDVVALDAKGRLWLNLTKDTYEQLGLDGKPARYAPKGQRFGKHVK